MRRTGCSRWRNASSRTSRCTSGRRRPKMAEHPIKAVLYELDARGKEKLGSRVPVQFNPETLKVTFANQVVPPKSEGSGDQSDTSRIQYVGKGTSKLSVQLWFDVTSDPPDT